MCVWIAAAAVTAYTAYRSNQASKEAERDAEKAAEKQKANALAAKSDADDETRALRRKSFRDRRSGYSASPLAPTLGAGSNSRSFFTPA